MNEHSGADSTVLQVLQRHLEQSTGPILLDGFPRVVDQVDKVLQLGDVQGVLFLDCKEAVLRERMDKTDCDDEIALIAQFTDHCLPVLDLYDKQGLVQVIDASASAEAVQSSLQMKLKAFAPDGQIAIPQEAAPAVDDVASPAPEPAPSADSTAAAPEPAAASVAAVLEVACSTNNGENVFKQLDTDKDGSLVRRRCACSRSAKEKLKSAPPGASSFRG